MNDYSNSLLALSEAMLAERKHELTKSEPSLVKLIQFSICLMGFR